MQQALADLGYDPGSTGVDGEYGDATWNAVKQFKANERLGWEWMGDVGPGTMRRLDELFPSGGDAEEACSCDALDLPDDPGHDVAASGGEVVMTDGGGAPVQRDVADIGGRSLSLQPQQSTARRPPPRHPVPGLERRQVCVPESAFCAAGGLDQNAQLHEPDQRIKDAPIGSWPEAEGGVVWRAR